MREQGETYVLDLTWKGPGANRTSPLANTITAVCSCVCLGDEGSMAKSSTVLVKPTPERKVNAPSGSTSACRSRDATTWHTLRFLIIRRIPAFRNRGGSTARWAWGPVRARLGDWKIEKGESATIRHRFVVYTGDLNDVELTDRSSKYSGKGASVQWGLAQQEGRAAEFLTPEKAVANMTLQDGFQVNAYAAEPMITQPMAFCWDDRGRMWIAENRDYESRGRGFFELWRQPHPDLGRHKSRRRG